MEKPKSRRTWSAWSAIAFVLGLLVVLRELPYFFGCRTSVGFGGAVDCGPSSLSQSLLTVGLAIIALAITTRNT